MRKIVCLLLVLALCLPLGACAAQPSEATAAGPGETSGPFADVPAGAGYAGAVAWCYDEGLMNGVSEGRFDPGGTLTRAMLATVLYRAGEAVTAGGPSFDDVEPGAWYENAVAWAAAHGIIQGYGNGLFGVDDPVSVEQLEVILGRYVQNGALWTGDPAKTQAATRAQVAVALMAALQEESNVTGRQEAETGGAGKTLVAYFSATNNTKGVAEKLAAHLGADLFEITPAVPYTAADLNYNADCRANAEQNDPAARPAVSGDVESWSSYDVVFLGYPIWWGVPPKIILTFAEGHDWSGKTVVPFCTSGSSGYNDSGLAAAMKGAVLVAGRRFPGGAGSAAISTWADSLELTTKKEGPAMNKLTVTFNGHSYPATLAGNPAADAFVDYLRSQGGRVTVSAGDYGGWEKVGGLGTSLGTANDVQTHTLPGDFVLYSGDQIVLFYGSNDWSYTPLGKLEGDLSSLQSDLGSGDVDITFAITQ